MSTASVRPERIRPHAHHFARVLGCDGCDLMTQQLVAAFLDSPEAEQELAAALDRSEARHTTWGTLESISGRILAAWREARK